MAPRITRAVTVADAGGRFRIGGLAPEATVLATATAHDSGEVQVVRLRTDRDAITVWNPRLAPTGRLSGFVVDERGGELAGLSVEAFVGDALQGRAGTAATGRFAIDLPSPELRCALVVRRPAERGGWTAALARSPEVRAGQGGVQVVVDSRSLPVAWLNGRVLVTPARAAPTVLVLESERGIAIQSKPSAEAAEFGLGPVPPGRYRLHGLDRTTDREVCTTSWLTLHPGVTRIDVELPETSLLRVCAHRAGRTAAGARLAVRLEDGWLVDVGDAGADGCIEFRLPPGRYVVADDDVVGGSSDVLELAGASAIIDFECAATTRAAGGCFSAAQNRIGDGCAQRVDVSMTAPAHAGWRPRALWPRS